MFDGCIQGGEVYRDRAEITQALIPIVNREMKALAASGVDFIQLDEPSFACHPKNPDYFLDVIARTVEGVKAKVSMHMCFGNFRARAVGWRSYAPLFPHLAQCAVHQLALEFASREMAEIELLRQVPAPKEVALGLVDVKNTWIEPPELVAEFSDHIRRYEERHRVRSGITGWSQVNGLGPGTSLVDRAEYDNWYIQNWSLWLDAKILLMTVPTVLRRSE